jgi:hypothetical protein
MTRERREVRNTCTSGSVVLDGPVELRLLAQQGVPPPRQATLGEILAHHDRAGAVGDPDG